MEGLVGQPSISVLREAPSLSGMDIPQNSFMPEPPFQNWNCGIQFQLWNWNSSNPTGQSLATSELPASSSMSHQGCHQPRVAWTSQTPLSFWQQSNESPQAPP